MPRRWFQIHLLTAIVMMCAAGTMLSLIVPSSVHIRELLSQFDGLEWDLTGTVADFATSTKAAPPSYTFLLLPTQGESFGKTFVVVNTRGEPVFKTVVQSFDRTTFLVRNEILYYPKYCSISSGCAAVAIDLKSASKLWETTLDGIGMTAHSIYSNRVYIKTEDDSMVFYGEESQGQYVERIDIKTGLQLSHRSWRPYRDSEWNILEIAIQVTAIALVTLLIGFVVELVIRRRSARTNPT